MEVKVFWLKIEMLYFSRVILYYALTYHRRPLWPMTFAFFLACQSKFIFSRPLTQVSS